jgi:hypothetical protein
MGEEMKRWTRWVLYTSVLALCGLAVYLAISPEEKVSTASFKDIKTFRAQLRDRTVASHSDVVEMARQAGLLKSTDIRGFVDGVKRVGDDVEVSGWGVDLGGDALHLFIFADGKLVGETAPKGERRDVTKALKLSDGVEENVHFSARVKCRGGSTVRVMAVIDAGAYYIMNSDRCP